MTVVPLLVPYEATATSHATVAAVQGNVPGDGTDVLAHYRQITHQHADETARLAADVAAGRTPRPDFVVWPENSTAIDPFEDQEMRSDIEEAVAAINVPLLAGVVVDGGPKHVLNQGIVFDPVTGAGDRYTKWHPVPFGEYIPWRWLFGTHLAQLNQIPRDMVAGTRVDTARRRRAEGGRRDLLRRGLRRRALRPAVPRRPAGRDPDQQRDVHPHRPDRPAVRDQPAAGHRDAPLRRGGGDQRPHRRDRPRRVGGDLHRRRAPCRTPRRGSACTTW